MEVEGIVNLLATRMVWQSCGMSTVTPATRCKNHRFPAEIISHAMWLYQGAKARACRERFRHVRKCVAEAPGRVWHKILMARREVLPRHDGEEPEGHQLLHEGIMHAGLRRRVGEMDVLIAVFSYVRPLVG